MGVPAREVFHDEIAREVRPASPPPPVRVAATRRGPSSRELLRRALSSPGAARQGFLLREVLGPPVALRTDVNDRPS